MITNLHLSNFKAFQTCALEFGALTLLTGMNGVGKSSVIQSLCLLRQSSTAGTLDRGGLMLNGELVQLGVGKDVLFERAATNTLEIMIADSGEECSWTFAYDPVADVLPTTSTSGHSDDSSLFGPNFQYLRADRVGPATSYLKSSHAVVTQRFLGAHGEFAVHFLGVHQGDAVDEARRQSGERSTPGLLSQVNAWMQQFSPGVSLQVFDVENTDLVRLAFQYGGSAGIDSSNYYRPTNVGFGLSYTLPVVIACLATAKGGLVLLENPEAHLHPRAQVSMGHLISVAAASGLQIIVETHSDHVLNGVRLAVKQGVLGSDLVRTHFFSKVPETGETKVESPRIAENGRLNKWPEGFFDQWESSLDELLG